MTIADQVISEAQSQGVDPRVALEVAIQESGLNPNAVSKAGAIGVMQLMPATAAALGVDPFNVAANIHGGVAYLKDQLSTFGAVDKALAAYNAGPARVAKAIAAGGDWLSRLPAETQNYVASITSRLSTQYQTTPIPPVQLVAAAVQSAQKIPPEIMLALGLLGIYVMMQITD